MIDTHAHLYDSVFDADHEGILQRAKDAGVTRVYLPNCDSSTIGPMMELVAANPETCAPMIGLHPCYVKDDYEQELALVEEWLEKAPFAAVGEIGLDYHWDTTFIAQQKGAFQRQMVWAKEKSLPIVIHSRESTGDCIQMVREAQDGTLRGVFHCFSGTLTEAEEIVELGFLLGIGGVVTYKNAAALQEVVRTIPIESLVLETDAPYLSPVPHRGKRNESAYTALIAQKIADLRGLEIAEVDYLTTANAQRLFGAE
jgi:TatD DNase family protein